MAYEIKTKVNNSDVDKFINSITDEQRKIDSIEILEFMRKHTKEEGKMYGTSIVGFGNYSYKTKSYCVGEWFKVGFSPRKNYLSIYIVPYLEEQEELIKDIGKAGIGKSCINVKKLSDINLKILEKLVKISMKKEMK